MELKYRVAYDPGLSLWTIMHGRRLMGGSHDWSEAVRVAVSYAFPIRRVS